MAAYGRGRTRPTFAEIRKLKEGDLAPAYLFAGEEDYLKRQALEVLRQRHLGSDPNQFTDIVLYGTETSWDAVLEAVATAPLFAPQRLVTVKFLEKLSAPPKGTLDAYLAAPTPGTLLVLVEGAEAWARRKRRKKDGYPEPGLERVIFKAATEAEVLQFLERECKRQKVRLEPAARRFLTETVGSKLGDLALELEKAALFVGTEDGTITTDVLKKVTGIQAPPGDFALANVLGDRDLEAARKVLYRLLEEGESPIGILVQMVNHFTLLFQVSAMERAGIDPQSALRLHPYRYKILQQQAALYRNAMAPSLFRAFYAADLKSKGGSALDPIQSLDLLLTYLCTGKKQALTPLLTP